MTTIIGIIDGKGGAWLGADGRVTDGPEIIEENIRKIFEPAPGLFVATCGILAHGQSMVYSIDWDGFNRPQEELEKWLYTEFVPHVREICDKININPRDTDVGLLVIYRGLMVEICSDLAVNIYREKKYIALGSGRRYALGRLYGRQVYGEPAMFIEDTITAVSHMDACTNDQITIKRSPRVDAAVRDLEAEYLRSSSPVVQ